MSRHNPVPKVRWLSWMPARMGRQLTGQYSMPLLNFVDLPVCFSASELSISVFSIRERLRPPVYLVGRISPANEGDMRFCA